MRTPLALLLLGVARIAAADGHVELDLRVHPGDSEQDEVTHLGLFPSVIIGAGVEVSELVSIEAKLAAAKVTAVWENIGGVANGFVAGVVRLPRTTTMTTLKVGVAFPLDRSIPVADCFMAEQAAGGDSLVLDYGDDPSCWDRSAYRRAALNRGAWDLWMWAPDWITAVATARIENRDPQLHYAVDLGAGAAFAATDAKSARTAMIVQAAGELSTRVSPRWTLGGRASIAGAILSENSPLILAAEAFGEAALHEAVTLRLGVLVPIVDLLNGNVPAGRGGYKPTDNISIGVTIRATF